MSLLSKFLKNHNNTMNTLAANQLKIKKALDNVLVTTDEILCVEVNLNIIQNYLNKLDEAINLSYVHILSKFIVPPRDLLLLIRDLGNIYEPNQLLYFKNAQSYYPVIQLTSIINDNMDVIFTIKVPILQQTNFVLYHVFPVPILNQTIIPTYPYYLLSLTDYLGMEEECPKQEGTFICPVTSTTAHRQDCIPNMLKNLNTGTCPTIGIQLSTPILQPIDQDKIILVPVPDDPIDVIESCPDSMRHVKIQYPTEITISVNCSVSYDNQVFINLPHKEKHLSILLPQMDFHPNVTSTLKLEDVNLKDISNLYKTFHSMQPLKIEDLPEDNSDNHFPVIMLSIIIFIVILIMLFIYCKSRKQPFNFKVAFKKTTTRETEDTPSQGNVGSHPAPTPSFVP